MLFNYLIKFKIIINSYNIVAFKWIIFKLLLIIFTIKFKLIFISLIHWVTYKCSWSLIDCLSQFKWTVVKLITYVIYLIIFCIHYNVIKFFFIWIFIIFCNYLSLLILIVIIIILILKFISYRNKRVFWAQLLLFFI